MQMRTPFVQGLHSHLTQQTERKKKHWHSIIYDYSYHQHSTCTIYSHRPLAERGSFIIQKSNWANSSKVLTSQTEWGTKSLPGGPQGAPRAARICNPSSESWNYPGVFDQLDMAGTPLRGGVPEACCEMPEPPQAAPFNAKIAVALLRARSLRQLSPGLHSEHSYLLVSDLSVTT